MGENGFPFDALGEAPYHVCALESPCSRGGKLSSTHSPSLVPCRPLPMPCRAMHVCLYWEEMGFADCGPSLRGHFGRRRLAAASSFFRQYRGAVQLCARRVVGFIKNISVLLYTGVHRLRRPAQGPFFSFQCICRVGGEPDTTHACRQQASRLDRRPRDFSTSLLRACVVAQRRAG